MEVPEDLRNLVELVETFEFDRDPDGRTNRVEIFHDSSAPLEVAYFTRCSHREISGNVITWYDTHESRFGATAARVLEEAIILARARKFEQEP